MDPLLADLLTAHAAGHRLVGGVGADQWSLPTPCPDWDVEALVRHVVVGNRYFAGIVDGGTKELPEVGVEVAELPIDALAPSYDAAAVAVLAALSLPGALEQTYATRLGEIAGEVVAHVRILEALTHGWDLSRATGQPLKVDEELVEREIVAAGRIRASLPPGFTPYGTPQPVPSTATALDRLVALLGRSLT